MKRPHYPIRAVSKLTGLSIDTLRAWERRHHAVEPQRDDRGRLYTEGDVERLQLLQAGVERGHAIGRIAALTDLQLKALLARSVPVPLSEAGRALPGTSSKAINLQPILSSIHRFDAVAVERELGRFASMLSPREVIHQMVTPLMSQVGDEWHQGHLNIAQEHLLSALLRNQLGALVRLYTRTDTPSRLLFATPAGEQHEFGILSAALLAAGGGLGVVYLGANLPAEEIVEAAKKTDVHAVVLGIQGADGARAMGRSLQDIAQKLSPHVELWVGGGHSQEILHSVKRTRALWLDNLELFEQHLKRLGARF
ncbi:MAG: MerR family transcriptional regulator [Acidobacteriia bacterium]|nr:MerR family transcriptional regulator [Terriglobia bacterium]